MKNSDSNLSPAAGQPNSDVFFQRSPNFSHQENLESWCPHLSLPLITNRQTIAIYMERSRRCPSCSGTSALRRTLSRPEAVGSTCSNWPSISAAHFFVCGCLMAAVYQVHPTSILDLKWWFLQCIKAIPHNWPLCQVNCKSAEEPVVVTWIMSSSDTGDCISGQWEDCT